MRGAHRKIVGLVLSAGLFGLGCGDDNVSPDGPTPDASVDRPIDGRGPDTMVPADAGPSLTIAAVELHGVIPNPANPTQLIPLMKAAVNVSTTPADFVPDFGSGGVPGCSAFAYDLTASTPKLPPATYDIGSVTATMYTGEPLHTAQATITCMLGAGGYDCDFPNAGFGSGNYPEVNQTGGSTPQHWIAPGDHLQFNIMGGSGIAALTNFTLPSTAGADDNFTTGSVVGKQGNVNTSGCMGDNTVQLAGNTGVFAFDQDLLVKFDCGTTGGNPTPCGLVAVSMSASETDPRKGANATCTALIASANNCVKMPAGALQVLHYNGWDAAAGAKIQTSVVHFGVGWTQTTVGGASGATLGAARGNFFIRVP